MGRAAQPGCPPEGAPLFVHAADGNDGVVLPLAATGARARAWASWHTLAWAPVRRGNASRLLAPAAAALRGIGVAYLEPLEPDAARALAGAFIVAGWRAGDRPGKANWAAHVSGKSFARFWEERPSRLWNTVARKRKRAELAFDVHRGFDPVAWTVYEHVYAKAGSPVKDRPVPVRARRSEGTAGTLRLGIASRGNRPVAAELWLAGNRIATIYKLAHREDERVHSPGSLLSAAVFEYVLTHDAPARISYGLGDQPYKADWMDERRELRAHLAQSAPPAGVASLLKAGLRRLVKRGRGV